ncbi:polymer-forming cytoskeletal protein [Candidatus Woesebacteria bacterium]|nr:MAG: polymer-forming cytoskeletal protein [Candidatus Woesebacteria bacterium]
MKKFRLFIVLLLLSLVVPITTTAIYARDHSESPKITSLSQDKVIDGDYLAFGERVEIYGTVNGDVYAAGGIVIVQGKINGDVLVAGGEVIIGGSVSQNVRVLGGNVSVTGDVGRNLSFGAGNVNVTESAHILGNIVGASGNTYLSGRIDGDIKTGNGTLTLSNVVGGNVESNVEDLRLTSKASVTGDLTYWSYYDASIDETATVGGTVTKKVSIVPSTPQDDLAIAKTVNHGFRVYWFVSTFLFGIIFVKLFSKCISNIANVIDKKPWLSLGYGFVSFIMLPILIILVFITIVGIPTATFLMFAYFMALYLAKFFTMTWVGALILKKINKAQTPMKMFVVGFLVYSILKVIPVVGFLSSLGFLLVGLGSLLLYFKQTHFEKK